MRFVGRRFASWVQSTSPYASARTPQSVSMTSMMPGNDDQENASTGQPGGASRTAAAALGASRPDARPATWLCAVICHMPTQPALGGTACPRSPALGGPHAHAARPWGDRLPVVLQAAAEGRQRSLSAGCPPPATSAGRPSRQARRRPCSRRRPPCRLPATCHARGPSLTSATATAARMSGSRRVSARWGTQRRPQKRVPGCQAHCLVLASQSDAAACTRRAPRLRRTRADTCDCARCRRSSWHT